MSITVACVRQGDYFGPEFVTRLARGVALAGFALETDVRFVNFTDRLGEVVPPGCVEHYEERDISKYRLEGWWAKMPLFDPKLREGLGPVLYFDLDMAIVGPLDGLLLQVDRFAICANFTRMIQARQAWPTWPCLYGSCTMLFPAGWGASVWDGFARAGAYWITAAGNKGDQYVIERLYPGAEFFPPEMFLHWRDMKDHKDAPPPGVSVAVYAGGKDPDTFGPAWARAAWHRGETEA